MAKRGNGEGSIFRDASGRWRVSLSIGAVNGLRKRKTKVCKTRADAVAELQKMRTNALSMSPEDNPTTVSQWMTDWLNHGKTRWSRSTINQRTYAFERWIVGELGPLRISTVTAALVRTLLTDMQEKRGASGRLLQLVRSTLMTAFNAALDEDLISANPVVKVKPPSVQREPINPFSEDEVRKILAETKGDRDHALFALAFTSGMRIGELLGLRWPRVDLANGTIRVEEQLLDMGGVLERSKPKTVTSSRTVELTKTAVDALIDHKAILLKEGHARSDIVFPARKGGPTRRTNFVRRSWQALLTRLNLTHRGFHHTRHTFATLALRRGVPLPVVSAVLGHASPEITLRVYSHFLKGDQRMAVAAMESIASGGSSVATTENRKSS